MAENNDIEQQKLLGLLTQLTELERVGQLATQRITDIVKAFEQEISKLQILPAQMKKRKTSESNNEKTLAVRVNDSGSSAGKGEIRSTEPLSDDSSTSKPSFSGASNFSITSFPKNSYNSVDPFDWGSKPLDVTDELLSSSNVSEKSLNMSQQIDPGELRASQQKIVALERKENCNRILHVIGSYGNDGGSLIQVKNAFRRHYDTEIDMEILLRFVMDHKVLINHGKRTLATQSQYFHKDACCEFNI